MDMSILPAGLPKRAIHWETIGVIVLEGVTLLGLLISFWSLVRVIGEII